MKKFFTLLVVLLCSIGYASADTVVFDTKTFDSAEAGSTSFTGSAAGYTITNTGGKTQSKSGSDGIKFSATGKVWTIHIPQGYQATAIKFHGRANDATYTSYISALNGKNYTSSDYVFEIKTGSFKDYSFTFDTPVAEELNFSIGAKETILTLTLTVEKTSSLPDANISWEGETDINYIKGGEIPTMPVFKSEGTYTMTFTSSDPEIASVTSEGVITAYNTKEGTATITATAAETADNAETKATVKITVKPATKDVYVWDQFTTEDVPLTNLVKTEAELSADQKIINDDYMTITAISKGTTSNYAHNYCGQTFAKGVQAPRTNAVPSEANPYGIDYVKDGVEVKDTPLANNSVIKIEALKNATLIVFGRRQGVEISKSTETDAEGVQVTTHVIGAPTNNKTINLMKHGEWENLPQEIVFGDTEAAAKGNNDYLYVAYKFDVKAGETYTLYTTGMTFTMHGIGYYDNALCSAPAAEVSDFNFDTKAYTVTFTAAEGQSLMVKVDDDADYSAQTSPYTSVITATAYAYAVASGMADSEVVEAKAPQTGFDPSKPYIAWVYNPAYGSVARFETEENGNKVYTKHHSLINVMREKGNVVFVNVVDTNEPADHLEKADLIVCSEAMTGAKPFSNGMVNFVGKTKMINLKFFNYTSGRWNWGAPTNAGKTATTVIYPADDYKVLEGVTRTEDGLGIMLFDEENMATDQNHVQYANLSALEGHTIMASYKKPETTPAESVKGMYRAATAVDATQTTMHGTKDFFALGLSSDDWAHYGDNATKIVSNAADMLLADEDVTAVNTGTTSLSTIEAENAPVEYFNLQGIRVTEPANGVFIRKQGTQVTKVIR